MAAAYGLYSHIQSNKRRSIALLLGLFFLVYVMVFAGALAGEALYYDASLDWLIRAAWRDTIHALPWATGGTILWVLIAYRYHQSLIDSVTGAREVTRKEEPRLYNLLENLCISRGIPMPKLKVMDQAALNAFASGLNEKQYAITVTTGLLERLDDAEVEAVLGHELTHIRNGDVRMLVIALVIAGVIGFFAELVFRMLMEGGLRWRPSRSSSSSDSGKGGGFIAVAIAVALDRSRLAALDRHPLRAVAAPRVSGRRRRGRADQEPGRHDHGAAQDRGPRRARGIALGGDGNVRRQPQVRLRRPVRHPSGDRQARGRAGAVRRRPRPGPDRAAAPRRAR